MLSVFPAHASEDAPFAHQLSAFLEIGSEALLFTGDAVIQAGEDLISTAAAGLSADILILIISRASNPVRWARDRWEPLFFDEAPQMNTRIAVLLLEDCAFPLLLRRKLKFFDATQSRTGALRHLKRWLRSIQLGTAPAADMSPELEPIYQAVADQPGTFTASGEMCSRFEEEAAGDFEAVFWIPCYRRSLAQIAGALGARMGMILDGPVEENCHRISSILSTRRCLVIFDSPQVSVNALIADGRTSFLFTSEPVRVELQAPSIANARLLVSARRFPEAYEELYELLEAGIEPANCARELIWICEHWDRIEEAKSLRDHLGAGPFEQLRLF